MAHRKAIALIATTVAAMGLGACASPAPHPSPSPRASPTPSALLTLPPSPSPTPSVPAGFQPEALSAISDTDFWVLGSTFCASGQCPPEIFHTIDAGRVFQRIPAPPTVSLDGNATAPGLPVVFDLRFADSSDGWVFGDQLWATHDGGSRWTQVDALGIVSVPQLEPGADGYVYAVFERCTVPSTATGCSFRMERSRAGSDIWSVIGPPGDPAGLPVIGVHGNTVWVMYFNGSTRAAWISHDEGALWSRGSMPCYPDLGGSFDPVSVSVIWAFCATGNFGDPWLSTNGGQSFTTSPTYTGESSNGAVVVAVSAEHAFIVDPGEATLRVTTDGGRTFQEVPQMAGAAWGGFTDSQVGYMITRDPTTSAMRLWRTTDAGTAWTLVRVP